MPIAVGNEGRNDKGGDYEITRVERPGDFCRELPRTGAESGAGGDDATEQPQIADATLSIDRLRT